MRHLPLVLALTLAGCGSMAAAELPAPAGVVAGAQRAGAFCVDAGARPADRAGRRRRATCREPTAVAMLDRGARVAVLCGRERVLDVYDARTLKRLGRTGAGIGPVGLATDGVQLLYVTDVEGDALLVFHLRPRFELIRRVHVIGGPYDIAFDASALGADDRPQADGVEVVALRGREPARLARYRAPLTANSAGADEQPALRVAVVVQAADVVEVAVALAADRAPEHEQHQQRQPARARGCS